MLTTDEIRTLLARLDGESADAIESDELECKEWNQADHKASEKTLRETVVCLANYRGGVIVLGVADKKLTRADAIVGVPSSLDRNYLSKLVYDGTDPHIRVEIEELLEPGGRRIVVIHVPCGRPAIHTTTDGVGKIRVGKECKPLKGSLLPRQPFDRVVTITHLALVAPIALSLLVGALAFVATQGAVQFLARPVATPPATSNPAMPTTLSEMPPTSSSTPLPSPRVRSSAPMESPAPKGNAVAMRIMVTFADVVRNNQEIAITLGIKNISNAPMMASVVAFLRLDAERIGPIPHFQWYAMAPTPEGIIPIVLRHDFVTADAFQEVWEGHRVLETVVNVGYRADGTNALEDSQYIGVGRLDPKTHRLFVVQSEWRPVK